jgi:hypothetical protein
MNERIFELAKQADLIQWDTLSSGARTPDHESVVKARKFAELIVGECAKIVEDSTWNLPHGYKTVDQANLVKQHFGVEE